MTQESLTQCVRNEKAVKGHAWINADVRPMGFLHNGQPGWNRRAEAVLWLGDTLELIGTTAEVSAAAARHGIDPQDLDGRIVLPGFVDAHTHFLHVGVKTTRPDLRGAKSKGEALERVSQWLAAHPGSQPIIAEGWDESEWPEPEPPSRQEIDGLVASSAGRGDSPLDRQVVLRRICGHIAVASSGALPVIRARWDDPAAVNLETGLLLEAPSLYLNEVLPSSPKQLDQAVQFACEKAHKLGVTAVGDYSQAPYRMSLQRAAARGTLTVRTFSSIYVQQLENELGSGFRTGRAGLSPLDLTPRVTGPLGDSSKVAINDEAAFFGEEHYGPNPGRDGGDQHLGGSSSWLQDGGLKVFLDGSLGGRTAYLRDPYLDLPKDNEGTKTDSADSHAGHDHGPKEALVGPRGSRIWTDDQLDHHFGKAHAAGIQIHAHAIGDAAIDQGLEAFERLAARVDLEGQGWQMERLPQLLDGGGMDTRPPGPPRAPNRLSHPMQRAGKGQPPLVASDANSALAIAPGQASLRHRFEHFEIVHDDQIRRTAALGIVASSQPNFVGEWSAKGGMYEARLGARYQVNNRFRSFKQAGIPIAFGSDGMPFGPLVGIESALRHPDPTQRFIPEEAIWHYTTAAAWAIHWEAAIGALERGKKADLVVLETRSLEMPATQWGIHSTVSGGQVRL